MKLVLKKKYLLGAGALAVGLILVGLEMWWYLAASHSIPTATKATTFTYNCSGGESMQCLQKQYQTLAKTKGITAAFTALKAAYPKDVAIQANCHQITHAIGRQAAEAAKNVADVYAQGDNFCWSGYYHGVMEAIVRRIGAKNVDSRLPTICADLKAKQPYSFYHYNCVHGLGHGIMDIKDGDLQVSLATCDLLTDNWEQKSCYGGVFMQNVMDELDDDHGKPDFKPGDPMYPCTAVAIKYKEQCYLMQTSHALKVAGYNFTKVFGECAGIEADLQDTCYQSLGRDASGNSTSNAVQTKATCMLGATQQARLNCVIGAVKDFISYYHSDQQADGFCKALDASLATTCQETKTQYYSTF